MTKNTGYIRKLNFKRTWGLISDDNDTDYYFKMEDINQDGFAIREGLAVKFNVIDEENSATNTLFRAMEVELG